MDLSKEVPWAYRLRTNSSHDRPVLRVVKDGQVIQKIPIGDGDGRHGIFSFGRLPECSLHLEHESISRRHACLAFDKGGTMYLVDLGSAHGTFLNGEQLRPNKRTAITGDAVIQFGASSRKYRICAIGTVVKPKESADEWAARMAAEKADVEVKAGGGKAGGKRPASDDDDAGTGTGDDGEANHGEGGNSGNGDGDGAELEDNDGEAEDDAGGKALTAEEAEEKRKRKELKKANRKAAKKAKWQAMKDERKAHKRRKKIFFKKDRDENTKLGESIAGQPAW